MTDSIKSITRHTRVPLGLAITIIGTVTLWIARVESRATGMDVSLRDGKAETQLLRESLDEKLGQMTQTLGSIDHRLSLIEGEVKEMGRK